MSAWNCPTCGTGYPREDPRIAQHVTTCQPVPLRNPDAPARQQQQPWTYKGVNVDPAGINSSGIRWSALMPEAGGYLKADTKAGMRELITHYLAHPAR